MCRERCPAFQYASEGWAGLPQSARPQSWCDDGEHMGKPSAVLRRAAKERPLTGATPRSLRSGFVRETRGV